jgi:hypothetical protein
MSIYGVACRHFDGVFWTTDSSAAPRFVAGARSVAAPDFVTVPCSFLSLFAGLSTRSNDCWAKVAGSTRSRSLTDGMSVSALTAFGVHGRTGDFDFFTLDTAASPPH